MLEDTALFLFLSSDSHARAYDDDLAEELKAQFPNCRVTTIGPNGDIQLPSLAPGWDAVLPITCAQMLSVSWSNALGFNVDNPFDGQGTLTRVVSGVRLHDVRP